MASLQDQLLKAGVVDKKKAKKVNQEKRQKAKKQPKGSVVVDEGKEAARRALAEKSERDRETNRLRQIDADKKAIQAQIVQLIKVNRIDRQRGDISYQFTDGKKIKKIFVTAELQDQLSRGLIAIVKLGEGYELVPAAVAEKIAQRDDGAILLRHDKANDEVAEDDPYAAYQIPDDLMW